MAAAAYVPIGKIVKAHGLKGAVKVVPYGETPEVFSRNRLLLAVEGDKGGEAFRIRWVKPGNRTMVVSFAGVDDRDRAESLAGVELCVDREGLPELEAGTYYWFDIIGLAVYAEEGRYVGRVTSIIQTGSNDVYVVDDGERETLVPALEWVVLAIDLGKATMRVALPEGP